MNQPKKQRGEEPTEEQCQPEPMNHGCEQHNCRMLFCRLTPELSRPVAGWLTRASVAHSTWLTPRHGVGLNELLGGGGCRWILSPEALAESRSGKARTRTCELSAGHYRSDRISSGQHDDTNHRLRSRQTRRMRCVGAPDGLTEEAACRESDRRAALTEARKGSIGKHSNQTLFCRLTPELSRPVAGRRMRASVA